SDSSDGPADRRFEALDPMNTPRLTAPLAAVAICFLLLASCSTNSGTTTGTAPASTEATPFGPAGTSADATVISLPLDPYFLPPADNVRLHTALDRLVTECLRSAGVQPPAPATDPAPVLGRYERRYGLTSAAGARTTGYHLPAHPDPAQVPLSPDQLNALTGPQGCQESAARRITGTTSYPGDAYLVRSVNQESFDRSTKTPEVVAAVAAWSRCMKQAGHDYATPLQTGTWPSEQPTDEERTTALTDVACKQQTRLVRIWNEAEAAIQRSLIQQNTTAFDNVLAERRRMLSEADTVLAEGPASGPGRSAAFG
ncbi:hypothetical protein ACFVVU_09230, partial [Kitasatospora sp. NPDC057965]|uniref:hypothetical protein n=1 Tax=Kitasatospora sp. NPDC057965 TaxID=3346291 RepID=UPI0036DBC404